MSDGLSKQRIVEHIANSLQLREMAQLGKTSVAFLPPVSPKPSKIRNREMEPRPAGGMTSAK